MYLLISISADLVIVSKIKWARRSLGGSFGNIRTDIPVKATVISAVYFMASVIFLAIVKVMSESVALSANTASIMGLCSIASRCPLVTALTFSAKARVEQDQDRERRQEVECRWARRRKTARERRRLGLNVDDGGLGLPVHIRMLFVRPLWPQPPQPKGSKRRSQSCPAVLNVTAAKRCSTRSRSI